MQWSKSIRLRSAFKIRSMPPLFPFRLKSACAVVCVPQANATLRCHNNDGTTLLDASKKLKNNKSSADDMLKNEMIKSALPILNKQIVEIFNIILKADKFPHSWTQGIIVPVHKQGSKFDANNYRGITLSSCFGKLFCHILNDRISQYLDNFFFLSRSKRDFERILEPQITFMF